MEGKEKTSKMLHGGRLGNVREDVAKFTSSRKDETFRVGLVECGFDVVVR